VNEIVMLYSVYYVLTDVDLAVTVNTTVSHSNTVYHHLHIFSFYWISFQVGRHRCKNH